MSYMGQAPDKFVAAAVRNPVCNLELMVGTTDISDWCYVEAYGHDGLTRFTEAPSTEHLTLLYNKSPISHLSKVCSLIGLHYYLDFIPKVDYEWR